jgi:hypothetical protein
VNEIFIFTFLIFGLLICLADWRKGVFFCILAGFLQDPIRKMMPEEPVYFSAIIAGFAFASFLGAKISLGSVGFKMIHQMKDFIRKPLNIFIILVIIQSGMAFLNTQNITIAGIGLIAYLSPIPVLLLAFYFVRNRDDIVKLIKFYLLISAIMVGGIYLSYMDYEWEILKAVGTELYVYPVSGGMIKLHPGFLRSSEVAAWHAGASICFIFILFITAKGRTPIKWISIPLTLYFIIALILAGRRKIIVELVLFLSIYGFLLLYFRRGATKLASITLAVGLLLAYVASSYIVKDADSELTKYFERPKGIVVASVDRLNTMTVGSFKWALARNGFFGSGAGAGSQGAQHFGGGASLVGYAAEGGFGKVLAELGVPGIIIFIWLLIALLRYIKWILDESRNRDFLENRLIYGLVSFLLANAIVFAVAHQVFGDMFVLFILSFILGSVLGLQRIQRIPKDSRESLRITKS